MKTPMKLNQREQIAVDALKKICSALESRRMVYLSALENNAMTDCLGIDLHRSTYPKKQVETFVRGKDKVLVELYGADPIGQKVPRYCFFPFQIKAKKPDANKGGL